MLPIKIELSEEFYKEEYRDGYFVTKDVKELWAVELDLLLKFDDICKKHNIKYWLDSGTLLGAVRHKGFIPWDDDIDVVVMREGYEKLLEVVAEFEEPYFLQSAYTDKNYSRGHLQLRNSKTCMMLPYEANIVDFNQGIFLDIFVLDGVTNDKLALKEQFKEMTKLKKYLRYITYQDSLNCLKRPIKKIRAGLVKFLFGDLQEIFDKFSYVAAKYSDCDFVDKLMFRNNPDECKFLKKEYFYNTESISFEGKKFPVPSDYDSVLKEYYGNNYMAPIQASSAHGNVIVSTRLSYKDVLNQ